MGLGHPGSHPVYRFVRVHQLQLLYSETKKVGGKNRKNNRQEQENTHETDLSPVPSVPGLAMDSGTSPNCRKCVQLASVGARVCTFSCKRKRERASE